MSLNYTPLRHKLLADIDAGRLGVYVGLRWNLYRKDNGEWIKGAIRAALQASGFVTPMSLPMGKRWPASLTESGKAQLAEWTAKHGEPSP